MASIFVSHGGGPIPLLRPAQHIDFKKYLEEISKRYPSPRGIIVFSAHWEEQEWTILDHDNPPLYYDYSGFPPETYNLKFRMSSTAQLRQVLKNSLHKQGVPFKTDTTRGYDHGVFIPMMMMYPEGKIPVIQISILQSLAPEAHFRMGVAMRQLKDQGFLIIGSGFSVHGAFSSKEGSTWSAQFDEKLCQSIMNSKGEEDLFQIAKSWRNLPFAKQMHPREQHLVPLWINLGAHQGNSKQQMKFFLYGLNVSNYLFS